MHQLACLHVLCTWTEVGQPGLEENCWQFDQKQTNQSLLPGHPEPEQLITAESCNKEIKRKTRLQMGTILARHTGV